MTNEEITMYRDALTAQLEGKPWQWRDHQIQQWHDKSSFGVLYHIQVGNLARPKPEPIYRAWTMDDVPLVCWLRKKQNDKGVEEHWCVRGVGVCGVDFGAASYRYADLSEKYEWSADRKTWQPCRIEVQS